MRGLFERKQDLWDVAGGLGLADDCKRHEQNGRPRAQVALQFTSTIALAGSVFMPKIKVAQACLLRGSLNIE